MTHKTWWLPNQKFFFSVKMTTWTNGHITGFESYLVSREVMIYLTILQYESYIWRIAMLRICAISTYYLIKIT